MLDNDDELLELCDERDELLELLCDERDDELDDDWLLLEELDELEELEDDSSSANVNGFPIIGG